MNKIFHLLLFLLALKSPCVFGQKQIPQLPYRNAVLPVDVRVDDLLARMTLGEKVGQINMPCVYLAAFGDTEEEKVGHVNEYVQGKMVNGIGPGGGFFTLPNTILHEGTDQQVRFINELQKMAVENTRLGIPLLMIEEGTHGLMCSGATIFPEGPALGATFNINLISDVYSATAEEARAIGIHELFTIVVEPIRDPRMGRNQEAYSEDPFYCSIIAESIVKAIQGYDISSSEKCIAGLCHFPGQSQGISGMERGAMDVSEHTLRSVFLPPWEKGIKESGALGIMATYPSINGVPVHASSKLLTGLLRDEYGFKGLVFSEGGGIETIIYEGLATDVKNAGQIALNAGVDVSISFESGFMAELIDSVKEGSVPESLVDQAVRRVLWTKFQLGLFENPFVQPEIAQEIVHSDQHQQLALNAAREGIVLLKNEAQLLPLSKEKIKSIAVIGPNADDDKNQLGDYTAEIVTQQIVTVLDGLRLIVPNVQIDYVKGCDVQGNSLNEINEACKLASASQIAVVVLGENQRVEGEPESLRPPTNGEGYDVATLELTGMQQQLIEKVVATGTPTIAVLINGRPLAVNWIAANVPAIIEAWIPGEQGGKAIAEVIFGEVNPSGKLPVTIPRHSGQLPVYYNYPKSKRFWIEKGWGNSYADLDPSPLYSFGHGLSYTEFEYSNLSFSNKVIHSRDSLYVTLQITNTGKYVGKEVVQLYIEHLIASVETPGMELRGFQKVEVLPGESKNVFFSLMPEHFALYNSELKKVIEPGRIKIMVGSASDDISMVDFIEIL